MMRYMRVDSMGPSKDEGWYMWLKPNFLFVDASMEGSKIA